MCLCNAYVIYVCIYKDIYVIYNFAEYLTSMNSKISRVMSQKQSLYPLTSLRRSSSSIFCSLAGSVEVIAKSKIHILSPCQNFKKNKKFNWFLSNLMPIFDTHIKMNYTDYRKCLSEKKNGNSSWISYQRPHSLNSKHGACYNLS